MSLNSQKSCARCNAYLFNEDDVVYCPVCGAPHHRECYNAIGHCALEDLHGTDEQYDLVKAKLEAEAEKNTAESDDDTTQAEENENVICKACGSEYPKSEPRCTTCGAPNFERNVHFPNIDFFGGHKRDEEIAEGVTAEDAAKFVNVNAHRYVPKFAEGRKASFNVLGFFFPAPWFFSRKMYKSGILATLISLIGSLFTNVSMEKLYAIMQLPTDVTRIEAVERMIEIMPEIDPVIMLMMTLGSAITVALTVLTGIFGDYWYRGHALETIREIKKNSDSHEEADMSFRKKGGVNLLLACLCHTGINYVTLIIMSLIM